MIRRIVGYHQDEERHRVADLECGHGQHVRHDPPWQRRDWVTTEAGRQGRLGTPLECVRCDEAAGLRTRPIAVPRAGRVDPPS